MRLTGYLRGERLTLHSTLSPDVAAERINLHAKSRFPGAAGIVGHAWSGHLKLRNRHSIVEYNAKPILYGSISPSESGSRFDLRFRAPSWIYLFYGVWYGFLLLIMLILLVKGRNPDQSLSDNLSGLGIIIALTLAPPLLNAIGTSGSDEDLGALLDFLETHAGALPEAGSHPA